MTSIWLHLSIVLATIADRELAKMVAYLKAENRILRAKLPKRIAVTPSEKSELLRLGQAVGARIGELMSIVSPRTFARWLAAANNPASPAEGGSQGGRPKTPVDVRALVLRFANENGWGYGRIVGELNKLGVAVSKSTVKAILRENGFEIGPKRGHGTWADFVERHAKTLWACDFFQKRIWTMGGFVDYFVLFFIHVGSRRVVMSGMTANPTPAWVAQQARNIAMEFHDETDKPTHLIRDNDGKFPAQFDTVFKAEKMEVVRTCVRAPNMNAFMERWLQSLQVECLDHFVVLGEDHFRLLVSEYVAFYNADRPHQSLENLPLDGHVLDPPDKLKADDVVCDERLGGVLKSYSWRAAA